MSDLVAWALRFADQVERLSSDDPLAFLDAVQAMVDQEAERHPEGSRDRALLVAISVACGRIRAWPGQRSSDRMTAALAALSERATELAKAQTAAQLLAGVVEPAGPVQ